MLKTLELKNYKSHKHFIAEFNGNSVIEGNKGSGKTSLKDAFYWIMTGSLIDDPTPVDKNGEVINHLTISAVATLTDGTILGVESKQGWSKDVLKAKHSMTYFVNGTPMIQRDYLSYLESRFGTLEQRKIMLDPTWFADGDGLRIAGKTPKTAWQRRREIVIDVAGMGDLEDKIAENEELAKQSKYAISTLKKELEQANAGIESLYNAKVDTQYLNADTLKQEIKELETEKENTYTAMQNVSVDNTLQEAYNNASVALSNARANYTEQYSIRLEQANKPLQEYNRKRQALIDKYESLGLENKIIKEQEQSLIRDIDSLKARRENALKEYNEIKAQIYSPDSVTCQCCGQVLPQEKLREHEARFNEQRSNNLEYIVIEGKNIADSLVEREKILSMLDKPNDLEPLRKEIDNLVEPVVETPKAFEETEEYGTLNKALELAFAKLQNGSDDSAKEIYRQALQNIDLKISELQTDLNKFDTNKHLDTQIEKKGEELQSIAAKLDEQELNLSKANQFIRDTLVKIEGDIEDKFDGIRFKMFDYVIATGEYKDVCITYGKTDVGYIPWESLSGGQKRSATIKLANAFKKAWGVDMPLWIDDTQIYVEDEVSSTQQLIRITEVPHRELVIR